jgi:vacuolar-type H+-ATPase subunit I/STV1
MTRVILIHHHIFKNAGTSFNYALKQYFGDNFFEFDLPDSKAVTQNHLRRFILQHPQALAISSHHACMPTPQGKDFQTISSVLLRKPLARIKSIYNFEHKQQAQTEGAIKAKELNFKDYVLWRLNKTPVMFCNYQTHYCSRVKSVTGKCKVTEDDLKIAIQNLKKCAIVGTVEKYDQSLKSAENKLRQFYPAISLKSTFLNTSSQTERSENETRDKLIKELGEGIVNKIEEMNKLDDDLYKVADDILSNK